MAVDVGVTDLIRSYVDFRERAGVIDGAAANLLLCYGVECGLKAAYLGKRGINAPSTSHLPPDLKNHSLHTIAKQLRLGPGVTRQLSLACRRRHGQGAAVESHQLHEAWRYGAVLNEDDERCAVAALRALSEWCRREHMR